MEILGILDLVIGLFFIYFLLSVVCSAIVEAIARLLRMRSKNLNRWIMDTFSDPVGRAGFWEKVWNQLKWLGGKRNPDLVSYGFGKDVLKHKLIDGLTQHGRKADYIPANVFCSVVLDLTYKELRTSVNALPTNYTFDTLESALENNDSKLPEDIRVYLLQVLQDTKPSGGSLLEVKRQFERWFDDAMARLNGTYKKRIRWITAFVAAIVVLGSNADSIAIAKYLERNVEARNALVDSATKATQDSIVYKEAKERLMFIKSTLEADTSDQAEISGDELDKAIESIQESQSLVLNTYSELKSTGIPLGWEDPCDIHTRFSFGRLVGWLLTFFAISLGATFWFDLINKLVNIRSSGKVPENNQQGNNSNPVG